MTSAASFERTIAAFCFHCLSRYCFLCTWLRESQNTKKLGGSTISAQYVKTLWEKHDFERSMGRSCRQKHDFNPKCEDAREAQNCNVGSCQEKFSSFQNAFQRYDFAPLDWGNQEMQIVTLSLPCSFQRSAVRFGRRKLHEDALGS